MKIISEKKKKCPPSVVSMIVFFYIMEQLEHPEDIKLRSAALKCQGRGRSRTWGRGRRSEHDGQIGHGKRGGGVLRVRRMGESKSPPQKHLYTMKKKTCSFTGQVTLGGSRRVVSTEIREEIIEEEVFLLMRAQKKREGTIRSRKAVSEARNTKKKARLILLFMSFT